MVYQTTITKKGQITIPKKVREILKLEAGRKLDINLGKDKKEIRIKPVPDILDLAGTFRPKRKIDVLKAREMMEKHYERL